MCSTCWKGQNTAIKDLPILSQGHCPQRHYGTRGILSEEGLIFWRFFFMNHLYLVYNTETAQTPSRSDDFGHLFQGREEIQYGDLTEQHFRILVQMICTQERLEFITHFFAALNLIKGLLCNWMIVQDAIVVSVSRVSSNQNWRFFFSSNEQSSHHVASLIAIPFSIGPRVNVRSTYSMCCTLLDGFEHLSISGITGFFLVRDGDGPCSCAPV